MKTTRYISVYLGLMVLVSIVFSGFASGQEKTSNNNIERHIVVPLRASVAVSEGAKKKPAIDFHDRRWIDTVPLEEGITGIPEDISPEFFGVFQLCGAQAALEWHGKKRVSNRLWGEYTWPESIDSRVSFISGKTRSGKEVFLFDTNNDEDFSEEIAVVGEYFSENRDGVKGFFARSIVSFEYEDHGRIQMRSMPVEVFKFTKYFTRKGIKFRGRILEFLTGQISIDGQDVSISVHNQGRYATYGSKAEIQLVFDVNDKKILSRDWAGNWDKDWAGKTFSADKLFSFRNNTFGVVSVSPSGDQLVLAVEDTLIVEKPLLKTGQFAPDFSVKDLNGKEVHLKDFSGKVVLLDFWATHCAPCIRDFPKLKALYESFSRDDLAIVGISIDRNLEYLAQFIEAKQIPWTQIPDGPTRGNTLIDLYNVNYIPGYFIIDRGGILVEKKIFSPDLVSKIQQYVQK